MNDPKVHYCLHGRPVLVYRNEAYNAFPDITLSRDKKRVICAWRGADHHVPETFSRILVSWSEDRGRTWSVPKVLSESRDVRREVWNCPSLRTLRDGRIILLVDRPAEGHLPEQERSGPPPILMFESTDDGTNWRGPVEWPIDGMCPDKLLETRDGTWWVGGHGWRSKGGSKILSQWIWRSTDQGQTWSGPMTVAADPELFLCEGSFMELDAGILAGYIRENSGLGYPLFKAISRDGGTQWELTQTNVLGGHRPKADFLSDGRVLVTYRFLAGRLMERENVMAYLEAKDSALETHRLGQRGRIIPLFRDGHAHADTGYTGWIEYPDGEVLVVNYIRGSNDKAYIHGSIFPAGVWDV